MSNQMALDSVEVVKELREKGYSPEEVREILWLAIKRLDVEGLLL